MRSLFKIAIAAVFLCTACAGKHNAGAPKTGAFAEVPAQVLMVSPDKALAGKVVRVNSGARFVVLNFPIGRMPAIDQRMSVYRSGMKMGEVKITGPQMDDNIIADLVKGEASPGDEVRDN